MLGTKGAVEREIYLNDHGLSVGLNKEMKSKAY